MSELGICYWSEENRKSWVEERNRSKPMKITTEAEYTDALTRIDELIDSEPGTPEHDKLIELGNAVADYEDETERL